MSQQKDLNGKAKDYLDAHKHRQSANEQLNAAQRLYNNASESLEKAEDTLTDCVGDNIAQRAFHIDGNTVLVEYFPGDDRTRVSVLNDGTPFYYWLWFAWALIPDDDLKPKTR